MREPIKRLVASFRGEERGAVLAETLIVVPFITLFSVGILEFGNMFWEKEQIETGLRDASRYLARCQANPTFGAACNQTVARNIAFYGKAAPTASDPQRVMGWGPDATELTFTTTTNAAGETVIRASTSHTYRASPLFGWLNLSAITINAFHEQRYIGW